MTTLLFDIETDGLIDELTTVHCLVTKDADTGVVTSAHHDTVEETLRALLDADLIVGHNIIAFDIPAIQKLYPWFQPDPAKVVDTLVCSRLIWPNVADLDWNNIRTKKTTLPGNLAGSHSLEAWGYRLGKWKGDYSKIMADRLRAIHSAEGLAPPTKEELARYVWKDWSQEMQDYCVGDVDVTEKLYLLVKAKQYAQTALDLEHAVAWIIAKQERTGFGFNEAKAWKLYQSLSEERITLEEELGGLFEPWYAPDGPTKAWAKDMRLKTGEVRIKGAVRQPIKVQVFNPGSREHIADRLVRVRGWTPTEFTEGGKPKVDEKVLAGLPYEEAQHLAKFFQVRKLLGQLGDGDNAWLKKVKNGRIHGRCNPNGAVTGRATHMDPNLGQVPSPKAYRGAEARELFEPGMEDYFQLGCDASGLELRMLGHFMARFDDGKFAREVVEGDVHWVNVKALGLVPEDEERVSKETEDNLVAFVAHKVYREGTKTFIYAFLYGAGGVKIGTIIFEMALAEEGKGLPPTIRKRFFKNTRKPSEDDLKRVGNGLKKRFLERTPALKALLKDVTDRAQKLGSLRGLDGRTLHVRSSHAALNTLLQSAGALVCKRWLVEFHALLQEHGIDHLVHQMAWVHDEVQLAVHKSLITETINEKGEVVLTSIVGELCADAVRRAGEFFNLRVPLAGEYSVGRNWKETH